MEFSGYLLGAIEDMGMRSCLEVEVERKGRGFLIKVRIPMPAQEETCPTLPPSRIKDIRRNSVCVIMF